MGKAALLGRRGGLGVSKKERNNGPGVPRPGLSELPAVPLVITLLVIVTLVALGVTRPW